MKRRKYTVRKANYLKSRPEARDKKYAEWRKKVYLRDGHKCIACGKRTSLCAHHLDGWSWFVYGRYDVKNGATLCRSVKRYGYIGCHDKFHKLYGTKRNTRAQFEYFLKIHFKKNLRDIL